MKDSNALFLQIVRALKAITSPLNPESKARYFSLGLSALEILEDKLAAEPDLTLTLVNPEEYAEKEWEDVNAILSQNLYAVDEEIFQNFRQTLTIHLKIEMIYVHKVAADQYGTLLKQETKEVPKEKEDLCDKSLMLLSACDLLLHDPRFQNHNRYREIQYVYHRAIDTHKQLILNHPSLVRKTGNPDLAIQQENSIRLAIAYLQKLLQTNIYDSRRSSIEQKSMLENIVANHGHLKDVYGGLLAKELVLLAYTGLEKYFQCRNDDDNMIRIRSKKEILELSNYSS